MARHRVIIPTYNEARNMPELIRRIRAVNPAYEILVVDDNSPDGTARIAGELSCHVIVRRENKGLSPSVVDGISDSMDCDSVVVMDADMQHPPEKLPEIFQKLEVCDLVLGQRRVNGNWTAKRRAISFCANMLAFPIAPRVRDRMTGFFGLQPSVVKGIDLNPTGYKIALELLAKGRYSKLGFVEFDFGMRHAGDSKLTGKVVREYLKHLWTLPLLRKHNFTYSKFTKFAIVGGTGTLIHWFCIYSLTEWAGLWYMASAILGSFVTVTWNFTVNALWTFKR